MVDFGQAAKLGPNGGQFVSVEYRDGALYRNFCDEKSTNWSAYSDHNSTTRALSVLSQDRRLGEQAWPRNTPPNSIRH